MTDLDLNAIIMQAPSFLGLLICIAYMRDQTRRLAEQNTRLIESIIRGDNCPDDSQPPHA